LTKRLNYGEEKYKNGFEVTLDPETLNDHIHEKIKNDFVNL
jgi:hypothetical protein